MPSKAFKEYEAEAMWFIPKISTIDTCVNVKCLFYMPTRRRCDLTNMLEAIDDIMVKARLLDDDSYNVIQSHDGSRILFDKYNPRTEVFIESAAADQPAAKQKPKSARKNSQMKWDMQK